MERIPEIIVAEYTPEMFQMWEDVLGREGYKVCRSSPNLEITGRVMKSFKNNFQPVVVFDAAPRGYPSLDLPPADSRRIKPLICEMTLKQLDYLRKAEEIRLPLIIVTTSCEEADLQFFRSLSDAVFTKPVEPNSFLTKIRELVA